MTIEKAIAQIETLIKQDYNSFKLYRDGCKGWDVEAKIN